MSDALYEVQLSRVVREYRIIKVRAASPGEAASRARRLSQGKETEAEGESVGDWCDNRVAEHHHVHEVVPAREGETA